MFSQSSEPISAFVVYKKSKNKVGKNSDTNVVPAKKDNLQTKGMKNMKINKSTNKVSGSTVKHNGIHKKSKKNKKKVVKNKIQSIAQNTNYEDEQPPFLVPMDNAVSTNLVKEEIRVKTEKLTPDGSNEDEVTSLSELDKIDPSPDGLKLFKWLIAPLNPEIFFETYWEQKVLFVGRNKETYYRQILTTERLDAIFREFPLYYTRNVDVVSYDNGVKEVHNEEGRVSAAALYDYYSNGCSIRILNAQTYDQKVHLVLATLQEYFGTMVGANVYLTPPGSQGFAPHYDDIEAFIVQLEGRKHWKLYKPMGSDVLARDSSPNLRREDIGDPFMEVTLNAGDLLYFPRGTIHEGRTDTESHSLHITLSVYQHNSYADLLEHILPDALKKAASENIEFREGLPINYLKYLGWVNNDCQSTQRIAVINKVQTLMETLINHVDVDQAADKLGRKFMYDSMPPLMKKTEAICSSKYDGDYMTDGKVFNRVEIDMDTEVRLLRYHCLRLVVEGESAKIFYNTDNSKAYHDEEEQFLNISFELIPCIKKLQNSYPEFTTVENLPVEDNVGKAQLVSDLWERGLLITNGPLSSTGDD
ncbi:hypothetical protein NQ315_013838 [Exocentrus adspersus]|uniref:Bifunctional lysine-specific demethylase and histidyl-hydroxylase n=1 Tax=Exocentrus adspersus TaxID=1586481 RepID=A0AAV8VH25_9CUCU|nr:hypothetical protein NQ315_013838 [Exocentrus adspersus]